MKKFEYQINKGDCDDGKSLLQLTLNDIGMKGWELVAVIETHNGNSFIFKREKLDNNNK